LDKQFKFLKKKINIMLVRDVMKKEVITAGPEITLREASKVMAKHGIGSIVIIKDDKIVGLINERNVLVAVAQGKDADLVTVEEIMIKKVATIEPGEKIEDAVNVMIENQIKKLPVIDGDKLIGIITASDIIVIEPKLIEEICKLISIDVSSYRGG